MTATERTEHKEAIARVVQIGKELEVKGQELQALGDFLRENKEAKNPFEGFGDFDPFDEGGGMV